MIGITFTYCDAKVWEALNWEFVKELIPNAQEKKPDSYYSANLDNQPYWVSFETATQLLAAGAKLDFVPPNGTMITKLRDRGDIDGDTLEKLYRGAAVQIAIPGFGLLAVSKIMHLDDACTDDVQRHLDEGWKILAVCPPNSQRRPDYILGR
jgi:hypothetical protein